MRPTQKSNRSRGRGNRKGGGGGGNSINRVYDSAGPEGKVRGTPQQIIDKYLSLARDAQTSGDRVTAENFLQHAEHYQRILIQAMGNQEQARRDAQQNADAQSDDDGPGGDTQPGAAESAGGAQPDGPARAAQGRQRPEIGGMAMIDAGDGSDDLLVEAEDLSLSQPRRNGGDRPRRRRPSADEAQPAADGPDAPAEG